MTTTKATAKYSRNYSSAIALIAVCAMVTGCASVPAVEVQKINIPIPVACEEPVPARPAMPTEALRPGATVDDFTRAAMAEIERREGYEGELMVALGACRAPIQK